MIRNLMVAAVIAVLTGCTGGGVDDEGMNLEESVAAVAVGGVDFSSTQPVFGPTGALYTNQKKVTASVKLTALTAGASGTLTYSLGREAYRWPYARQTEIRTVTLAAGQTEVTDSVSTIADPITLPFTWYVVGTLTTADGSIEVKGAGIQAKYK